LFDPPTKVKEAERTLPEIVQVAPIKLPDPVHETGLEGGVISAGKVNKSTSPVRCRRADFTYIVYGPSYPLIEYVGET